MTEYPAPRVPANVLDVTSTLSVARIPAGVFASFESFVYMISPKTL
jgi:hypothetical protein